MIYRVLGKEGPRVSAVALGTSGSGAAKTATVEKEIMRIKLYKDALESGINFFDTAELYGGGYAEELLGRAVRGIREKAIISSKFNPGNDTADKIMHAAEGSLKRLQTDYLDLYQVHWPNPQIPLERTMTALGKLAKQGKIRHVGVSNFSLDELREARLAAPDVPIAAIEIEYNLRCREEASEMLSYCQQNSITVLAYSPLNQGRLTWRAQQAAILQAIALKHGCTPAQVALSWVISHPGVLAIVRTGDTRHLKENAAASLVMLDDGDRQCLLKKFSVLLEEVPVRKISIKPIDPRKVYSSAEEALENKLDWIPAPALLAERIREGRSVKPIKLVRDNHSGAFSIDPYDFMGEMKKFWAWVIVHGYDRPIPAHVSEDL